MGSQARASNSMTSTTTHRNVIIGPKHFLHSCEWKFKLLKSGVEGAPADGHLKSHAENGHVHIHKAMIGKKVGNAISKVSGNREGQHVTHGSLTPL